MPLFEPYAIPRDNDLVYGVDKSNTTRSLLINKYHCVTLDPNDTYIDDAYRSKYPEGAGLLGGDTHFTHRACKIGIQLSTFSERHVHFVLDKMTMDRVKDKLHKSDPKAGVTDSELRWIYRYRNCREVKNYVQFWFDEKPCTPPWVVGSPAYTSAFQEYDEARKVEPKRLINYNIPFGNNS